MTETSRLYDSYATTHFDHSILMRQGSYDDMAKFYQVHYGSFLPSDRSAPIAELGCGAGHFLHFARKAGYTNVQGIDLSPQMVALCHEHGLTNAEQGDVFDFLDRHRGTFKAVVCNDLIEHIPRARMLAFIDAVHGSLDKGTFLVKTINAASLFGAREVFIDFTHEVGFTPESLAQVLRLGRFSDVVVQPLRPVPSTLKGKILRVAGERVLENLLKVVLAVHEGPRSRQPMVLTNTMLAIAHG